MHISYVQRRDKISMKTSVAVRNMARNVVNLTSNVLKSLSYLLNDLSYWSLVAVLVLAKYEITIFLNILWQTFNKMEFVLINIFPSTFLWKISFQVLLYDGVRLLWFLNVSKYSTRYVELHRTCAIWHTTLNTLHLSCACTSEKGLPRAFDVSSWCLLVLESIGRAHYGFHSTL